MGRNTKKYYKYIIFSYIDYVFTIVKEQKKNV